MLKSCGKSIFQILTGAVLISYAVSLGPTPTVIAKNCSHIVFISSFSLLSANDIIDIVIYPSSQGFRQLSISSIEWFQTQVEINNVARNFVNEVSVWPVSIPLNHFNQTFNVTFSFRFPNNNDTYQFGYRRQVAGESNRTDFFGKSKCIPPEGRNIVCENSCLCDTVIYESCFNQTLSGNCLDPGTLTQSPGNLVFKIACPSAQPPSSLTGSAIAGIVIGVIVVVLLIVGAIYFKYKQRKR